MKNFIREKFAWFYIPVLILMIIVLSIENTTVKLILVGFQTIFLGIMIYGAILFGKKIKKERNNYMSLYFKEIEDIKSSRLPENEKSELITMCQHQINRLKKIF